MSRISVIVPVYNGEKTIGTCLNALSMVLGPEDEIIVVDDASTDQTCSIVSRYNCQLVSLVSNKGAAHARNCGALTAKKDVLLFVDADIVVDSKAIQQIRNVFSEDQVIHSVTANLSTRETDCNFFTDYKNLYMNYVISQGPPEVNYVYGAFCATRKVGFIKWPEHLRQTEDSLWGYIQKNLGLKVQCLRQIEVQHLKTYSLCSLIKNDFTISSFFARSFAEHCRWNTLYTSENFGHTSKLQKMSIILVAAGIYSSFFNILFALLLLFCWLLINMDFFSFLFKKRSHHFVLKSVVWTFFDHVVYLCGISHGLLSFLVQKTYLALVKAEHKALTDEKTGI